MRIKGLTLRKTRRIENNKYRGTNAVRLFLRVARANSSQQRELFFILTTCRCFIWPRFSPLSATTYRYKLRNHASPLISPRQGNRGSEAIMRLSEMQSCSRHTRRDREPILHKLSFGIKFISNRKIQIYQYEVGKSLKMFENVWKYQIL